jgi:TldD protein
VRNATLIGNGPSRCSTSAWSGSNLELDEGMGVCGKEGQSVPVGVGMPTIKIDKMTVGGTA